MVIIQKMFILLRFCVYCDIMVQMACVQWGSHLGRVTVTYPTLFLASWGQKPCLTYSSRNSGALLGHGSKDGVERWVGRMGEVWGDRLTPPKFLRH